jgi:hypothetical protein
MIMLAFRRNENANMKTAKLFVGILVIAMARATQAQVPITNGLVAYYPFNGNANDASGNGNDLTNNGATLCPDRFGNPNQAYSFDGSSFLSSSNSPLSEVDDWTVTAWIQPGSLNQSSGFAVCVGENSSVNNGFGFGISGGNQLFAFFPGVSFAPDDYVFTSTNQWNQVVMLRSAGAAMFYVNGIPSTNTFLATPTAPPTAFEIGSAGYPSYGESLFFVGAVDDVRVYNRALSSNEVQELYEYEAAPEPCLPRPATASATVEDGFVIAVTLTDGGCGYTSAPTVTITGGGGNGAQAEAVVSNREVIAIEVLDAGSGYTNAPLVVIASPPNSNSYAANAIATVVDRFMVAATVSDCGYGYTNTPLVLIMGGGGSGAAATAVVSNGVVVGITVTDAGSNYTSIPTLYIGSPPSITAGPPSLLVNAYDTASLSVTASGTVPLAVPMSYQWSYDGTNIAGATCSSLTISNVVPTNLGTYAVVVTNLFGLATSSNATLSMYPFLVTPFAGLDTYRGNTNTLSVEAWGTGPLGYQWFDNGIAIENATNQSLIFSDVQLTNAGLYSVVVSSPFGSVTNTPQQVLVNPAGVSFGGLYPSVLIRGVVGNSYIIQSTANISDSNSWVTVTNLTLTQPVQLWVDTNINAALPANPQQFFRILPGQ